MRKILFNSMVMLAAGILAASCINKDDGIPQDKDKKGTLKVSAIKLSEASKIIDETRAGESTGNFTVTVTDNATGEKAVDCLFNALEPETELPVGSYTIRIESPAVADAEWNKPYYSASQTFEIRQNEVTDLSEIICDFANIMVTVEFSENMMNFISADSKVEIKIGTGVLIYRRGNEVMVESSNQVYANAGSAGFFKAPNNENTLIWEFTGEIDGEHYESLDVINKVKAGQHRNLKFDIERGSGDAEFNFTVTVECETIDLNHNIEIEEEVLSPAVVFGSDYDFDKRHVLKLSESLNEAGEPVIGLGVNVAAANGLSGLTVEITSNSQAFNALLEMGGITGPVDLVSPGALESVLREFGLPTGSAVSGAVSLDIDFAGLLPVAFSVGSINALDIRMAATDSSGGTGTKTLKLRLTDDSALSTISIEWIGRNIDQRQIFRKSEVINEYGECTVPVVVDITAPAGISKFEVTIISSILGLDKASLNSLGLDDRFDLVSPHYVNEEGDLEAALGEEGLGFPLRDQVKDQTYLQFDITTFVPLIFILGQNGTADFQLAITDNTGNTETKTIQLDIIASE